MVLVLSGTSQTCAVPVSGFLLGLNKSSLVFPTLPEFQLEETPVLSSSLKLQISRKAQKTQLIFQYTCKYKLCTYCGAGSHKGFSTQVSFYCSRE